MRGNGGELNVDWRFYQPSHKQGTDTVRWRSTAVKYNIGNFWYQGLILIRVLSKTLLFSIKKSNGVWGRTKAMY